MRRIFTHCKKNFTMMKNTITVFVRYCLLLVLPAMALTAQKPITLEDIWSNNTFETKTLPGFRFQNDGAHYTVLNDAAIEQFDLRSGKKTAVLFDAATVPEASAPGWTGTFENYTFSADESKILLASDVEAIYRHSKRATYFVFDTKSKKITRLHGGVKLRYPTFSPDGNKVAYVLENDLYVLDLASGKNARLTNDGAQNAIINGASDWVYEEEFALVRAFEWSPDSRKIAYLRFDERAVPEYTIEMYRGGDYPEPVTFKYPKVGEPNSTVTAHIADLASAKTIPVKLPTPQNDPNDPNTPEYLPRIAWTPDGRLCLTRLNRHQNHLTLLLADPATGACTRMLEESSDYYLDLQEPVFLADGSGFIWQSEKSGFMHLYRYDMEGQEKAAAHQG